MLSSFAVASHAYAYGSISAPVVAPSFARTVSPKASVEPLGPEASLAELIASKKAVIDSHNRDVDASMKWLSRTLAAKEVRTADKIPGADLAVLDRTLPGDWGWDPLRLAESKTHLLVYQEAEIKHGRLAMLAAAGWPGSELIHGILSGALGTPSMLTENGNAPSVLNGGLGQFSGAFWLGAFALAALIESNSLSYQFEGWTSTGKPWKYNPGDLDFDPLELSNKLSDFWAETAFDANADYNARMDVKENVRFNLALAEIAHGRVAMLAITAFALQEAVSHKAVVDQVPIFFGTPVYHLLSYITSGLHNVVEGF